MAWNVKPRHHASQVAFVALALLAFVLGLLRAPSLETFSEATKKVVTREHARVAIASRGEPQGRPHADPVLDAFALANGSSRSACVASWLREPAIAPRATWVKPAKTQADLMVFLN